MAVRPAASSSRRATNSSARPRKSTHSNTPDVLEAHHQGRVDLAAALDPPPLVELMEAVQGFAAGIVGLNVHHELGAVLWPLRIVEHLQPHRIFTEELANLASDIVKQGCNRRVAFEEGEDLLLVGDLLIPSQFAENGSRVFEN